MTILPISKLNQEIIGIELDKINRHGLIAGATGTGKTITLKVIAEQLSQAGIPVFLADIKGDLASLSKAAQPNEKIQERITNLGLDDYEAKRFPVRLWDIFGESGTPVRSTISEMGPLLLARLLDLNDTQTGILNIAFKIADDKGLLLIDMKDLKALLQEISENASQYSEYGNIAKQSVGAIQRGLLSLEQEGGDIFFGEPALNLTDFMQVDASGQGIINILMAQKLYQSPKLFSTFLLWMLSELFEILPEVGDLPKPKMVYFFDEAHLLFNDAPKAFVEKVEQVVRLIRSKGVGIYFITQNPADLPETVLAQLGNRVQHALRAYTPKEIKAVKLAASTFRPNPNFDTADVITELKVGEALVSCLNSDGQPNIVEKVFIRPPESLIGTLSDGEFQQLLASSPFEAKYRQSYDRESAYEILQKRVLEQNMIEEKERQAKEAEKLQKQAQKQSASVGRPRKSSLEKATDSFLSSVTRTVGRELVRGLFGSLTKRK